MAWYNIRQPIVNVKESIYKPLIFANKELTTINEQFKSKTIDKKITFPAALGVEHPFSFKDTEGIYKKVPLVMGAVDKYVDFIVGPGFYVKSKNVNAQKIIEDFITDFNFDVILRSWVKEALIKGNGFLELGGKKEETVTGLKVLDADTIYIDRNDEGIVKTYNQYLKGDFKNFQKEEIIPINPFKIAHISINTLGTGAYGLGIISPALVTVNNFLKNEKDLHTLISRKANSPLHIKVGDMERNLMPTPEDITAIGGQIEYLNNKHEWVSDPTWDMKVVDFGNFGDKFSYVLEHDAEMLLYGFQVPKVLMGAGNIPEGLAKVQMDAWERNIQSKQAEIEKVIEQDIFKRVLNSQNIDAHVEFEWGRPSNDERNENVTIMTELLKNPFLNPGLMRELEKRIAKLYDIDTSILESAEEERQREEEEPQPVVPSPNEKATPHIHEKYTGETLDGFKDMNLNVREWVGFNYGEYVDEVIKAVQEEQFIFLKARGMEEIKAGKFTAPQLSSLRNVLTEAFAEGKSIREIAKEIHTRVRPKTLLRMKDGKIIKKNGRPLLKATPTQRSIMIARTETVRVAAKGQIKHYKKGGVKKVSWVAAFSERTCPLCESLNGQIFDINNATLPPAHVMCRCTTVPVTELE